MNDFFNNDRFVLDVADVETRESCQKVMERLHMGTFMRHSLTNSAISFSEKEVDYIVSFSSLLKSKNYKYVLECKGDTE